MLRSTVNEIVREADAFIASFGMHLPPFARWTPDEMRARREEIGGIVAARLGWDVTDYGAGRFETLGLTLFTARNGRLADLQAGGGMAYAEKVMVSRRDQISPLHRHVVKAEDIICRNVSAPGAGLAIEMFESGPDGAPDPDRPVRVHADGIARELPAGGVLRLAPGESVTLMPGNWHKFWGEGGDVLIGEVSTVNDDESDNVFAEPIGRFSRIEENEAPERLLVSDYPTWLG